MKSKLSKGWSIFWCILFAVVSVVFMLPLIWMLLSSFKPEGLIMGRPEWLIPRQWTLEGYSTLLKKIPFFRFLLNSLIFAGGTTVSMLFLDSMAGYAFAKLKFRGSHVLFVVVLISMMIPFQITMIPTYLLLNDLHILNTYAGLMIPRMTNAFGIYFMRQAFLGVPNDLLDAGRIDGLTEFGIYRKIAIPVVGASIATLAVFHFMAGWNDFMWPMLMTNSQTMQTLPVGLALFQGEHTSEHGPMFAGAVLSILPIFIAFLCAQKTFIQGIALSGIKG